MSYDNDIFDKPGDYIINNNFQLLLMGKIAHLIGAHDIYDKVILSDSDDVYSWPYELFYACMEALTDCLIDIYDEGFDETMIKGRVKSFFYFSKNLGLYEKLFGSEKAALYKNVFTDIFEQINSFSYSVSCDLLSCKHGFINGFRLCLSPEFDFYSDTVLCIYEAVKYCNETSSRMRSEIFNYYKTLSACRKAA